MPTSRQQLEACLTKLRAVGIQPPRSASTADGFQLMLGLWVDLYGRYDPQAVVRATDRWIREREDWPLPKHFLPVVDAEQAKLERPVIAPRWHDEQAALNAALNQAMARLPSSLLVLVYEAERADPDAKRRFVNRFAEWAMANPGAGPEATAAFARSVVPVPLEVVA